jgi:hypothetical protein
VKAELVPTPFSLHHVTTLKKYFRKMHSLQGVSIVFYFLLNIVNSFLPIQREKQKNSKTIMKTYEYYSRCYCI